MQISPIKEMEGNALLEAKWPFLLLTIVILFGIGYAISTVERVSVMNNWTDRRCGLPIMIAAAFFKPDNDMRTSAEFAKDNFSFCMKSSIDSFLTLFMTPIHALFEKHVDAAGNAVNMVNVVRGIAQTMYNAFSSYLEQYYKKFNSTVFEMSRIVQYVRMAMQRMNAIALSLIYSGISFFRAMINAIQYIIRVVLIICGIMLVIIILLWFILFPVIPIILAALGIIVASTLSFSGLISPSLSSDAQDKMGGFCFAEGSKISNNGTIIPVEELKVGQDLGKKYGRVTTVIRMKGEGIPLYNLNGIYVSGSHLVQGTNSQWKSVMEDERAIKTEKESPVLYCFNTTTNTIPLVSTDDSIILFRDWEEIANEDETGHSMWNALIDRILNRDMPDSTLPMNLPFHCEDALMGKNVLIRTRDGPVPIGHLMLRPFPEWGTILDRDGKEQTILAVIEGEIEHATQGTETWHTEWYEETEKRWKKSRSTVPHGTQTVRGYTLITETGEIVVWDAIQQKERIIRDYTEIGYQRIHETYSFTEARLRMAQ